MKNLKTIAVFCLTIFLFSFQTKDNLKEKEFKVKSQSIQSTSTIYINYGQGVTEAQKIHYRSRAINQVGNFQVTFCFANANVEVWNLDVPYRWTPNDDGLNSTDVDIPDNGLDVHSSSDPNSIKCSL